MASGRIGNGLVDDSIFNCITKAHRMRTQGLNLGLLILNILREQLSYLVRFSEDSGQVRTRVGTFLN